MIIQAMSLPNPNLLQQLNGICALPHLGVIQAQGEDAANFLHNQLTNDVLLLPVGQARLAAFCNAKGRMQASFVVIKMAPDTVLLVLPPDSNGDLFARPLEDTGEEGPEDTPRILILPQKGDPALAAGMKILARLTPVGGEDHGYQARLIRALGSNPLKVLGVYRSGAEGGRIVPIDKGVDKEWKVARDNTNGARDGELVEAEQVGPKRLGLPQARITARLGDPTGPRAVSLIAIHQHGIPDQFPDAVISEADRAEAAAEWGLAP